MVAMEGDPITNAAPASNDEQAQLWNGPAGRAWVDTQDLLDGTFKGIEDRLAEAVAARPAARLLDIGCGTGATTLAASRRLGPNGSATGIDISAPMIEIARARAKGEALPARFIQADAAAHAFAPASCDMLISRFGVMFFADPVRAFVNLRRAASDGATLHLVAWRGADENPFMTAAERAAAPLLPSLPPRRPDAPGQFAFADPDRVRRILAESGWAGIDIRPADFACCFPEKGLRRYLTRLGPLGVFLHQADEATRARVAATVRPAFDAYMQGAEIRFTAACWIIGARARQ